MKTATSVFFRKTETLIFVGIYLFFLQTRLYSQTDPNALAKIQAEERLLTANHKEDVALAERIANSSLASRITQAQKAAQVIQDILAWIKLNPEAAAAIGLGLAQDAAAHDHHFENSLNQQLSHLEYNPGSQKNAYNELRRASRKLRAMNHDSTMTNEERTEIIKTLFEGRGDHSNQIIRNRQKPSAEGSPATSLSGNFYDRLSVKNLAGYSPNIAALQSQMNRWHVPNAPVLAETGYLNYQTLAYPSYAMAYDISNLKARLTHEEAASIAKKLGIPLSRQQTHDPQALNQIIAQAVQKKMPLPRDYQIQAKTISEAENALKNFNATATQSRNPKKLTAQLLIRLGEQQRQASRWINAAFLEEDMNRIEDKERLLSPDLKTAISECPVSAQDRGEYLQRGQGYFDRFKLLKIDDFKALNELLNQWPQKAAHAKELMGEATQIRNHIFEDLDDFVTVPYRLLSLQKPEPHWKELLNDFTRRFLSWTSYGEQLQARDQEKTHLKNVFLSIAMGDQEAARKMLHPQ